MFAKTKILTLSEFLHSTGHAMKEIFAKKFLQVWWCGGSEEKTRAEGKEGEEREKGEERRGWKEERGKGKRRKEAWAEEKKWKKWVKELKLEIEKNTHAGRKKGKFKTTFKV